MPIVHPCAADGCETLTMGELCLACERELEETASVGDLAPAEIAESAVPASV
jgi:predicted Fe-S protein YdhL (DUF1289 family)